MKPRIVRAKPPRVEDADVDASRLTDFGDSESTRVLSSTARVLAGELGRQAAREYFAEVTGLRKEPL
jgi:hypothetical protein